MTIARWSASLVFAAVFLRVVPLKAASFPPVSEEETKMTSIPEQPGAPAVILMREEIDDDMNNMEFVHERLKILHRGRTRICKYRDSIQPAFVQSGWSFRSDNSRGWF